MNTKAEDYLDWIYQHIVVGIFLYVFVYKIIPMFVVTEGQTNNNFTGTDIIGFMILIAVTVATVISIYISAIIPGEESLAEIAHHRRGALINNVFGIPILIIILVIRTYTMMNVLVFVTMVFGNKHELSMHQVNVTLVTVSIISSILLTIKLITEGKQK